MHALDFDLPLCTDAGGGVAPEVKEAYTPVQPLRAKLNVASKGDKAAVEEAMKVSYALAKHEAEPKYASVSRFDAFTVGAPSRGTSIQVGLPEPKPMLGYLRKAEAVMISNQTAPYTQGNR